MANSNQDNTYRHMHIHGLYLIYIDNNIKATALQMANLCKKIKKSNFKKISVRFVHGALRFDH